VKLLATICPTKRSKAQQYALQLENMDKLSDLIKGRLDTHNLSQTAKSAEILYKTNVLISKITGGNKTYARAYRFSGGVIYISTENSAWSQEIWGVSESIVNSLKKSFGEKIIKKVVIKNLTFE